MTANSKIIQDHPFTDELEAPAELLGWLQVGAKIRYNLGGLAVPSVRHIMALLDEDIIIHRVWKKKSQRWEYKAEPLFIWAMEYQHGYLELVERAKVEPPKRQVSYSIPMERPPSMNRVLSQTHWGFWHDHKKEAYLAMRSVMNPEGHDLFDCRVDIWVTCYFKQQPQDADNIMVKGYIDALIGLVIPEDDMQWVRWVCSRSEIDAHEPRLEIIVIEV
jgi:Holliday junction resolvase RusA-like endonuclease